jgi:hypothetical protein
VKSGQLWGLIGGHAELPTNKSALFLSASLSLILRPLAACFAGIKKIFHRMVPAISFFALYPRAISLNQFIRL